MHDELKDKIVDAETVREALTIVGSREWDRCVSEGGGICSSYVLFCITKFMESVRKAMNFVSTFVDSGSLVLTDSFSLTMIHQMYKLVVMTCKVYPYGNADDRYALCFINRIGIITR